MNLRNRIREIIEEDECGTGMYWCEESEKCKPIDKKKRKKEQTTAGAAGAYSQPLFGKPMKRKIAEELRLLQEKKWWQFWKKRGPEDGCPCDFTWNGSEYVGSNYRERCCEYGNKVDVPDVLKATEYRTIKENLTSGDSCCKYKIVVTMAGHGDNGGSQKMICTNCSCQNAGPCVKRYDPKNSRPSQQTIRESELIGLIEKSIYAAKHGGVIKEALTDADERRIGVLARKELKDYEVKLEKKIDQMITKSFKGKEFEDKTLKITKNALIQLYKALWIRRSFWSEYIKNTPS